MKSSAQSSCLALGDAVAKRTDRALPDADRKLQEAEDHHLSRSELPRLPSGKINKVVLRQLIRTADAARPAEIHGRHAAPLRSRVGSRSCRLPESTTDVLSDAAVTLARQCVLDWFAVTIPGAGRTSCPDPARGPAGGRRAPGRVARRGRCAHLGDERRVGQRHGVARARFRRRQHGDPRPSDSGGTAWPARARPRRQARRANEILVAFVAGYDVACRTGTLMSPSHYGHGFHATATVGSIGPLPLAPVCSARCRTTATAFGIAATMASGLKSMFGTMCKPCMPGAPRRTGCRPRGSPHGGSQAVRRAGMPTRLGGDTKHGFQPDEAMGKGR